MAGNDRQHRIGQFAVDDVQIGAADAAGGDFLAKLAGAGVTVREVRPPRIGVKLIQHHGLNYRLPICVARTLSVLYEASFLHELSRERVMPIIAEPGTKAERIEIRVTPHAKALLTAAAQVRHTTVSEFLLTNGIDAAERALSVPRVFYASEAGWEAIQQMLDAEEDHRPSDATISWLTNRS